MLVDQFGELSIVDPFECHTETINSLPDAAKAFDEESHQVQMKQTNQPGGGQKNENTICGMGHVESLKEDVGEEVGLKANYKEHGVGEETEKEKRQMD